MSEQGVGVRPGGMEISQPAMVRGNWAVLVPHWGVWTVCGLVRTHYASWLRSRWRRAMNRLASAQVTSRRWVFLLSPR